MIASVTRLGNLTSRKLVVLVDPATQQYQIDWERSALINGLVPSTFTIAEENRTHDLSGQTGPLIEILQVLKNHGIGMNNMIDLRSNPAARQQVQAIVRRAAATQRPTAAASAAPSPGTAGAPPPHYAAPPEPSVSQRLQELETLRASGVISGEEYTTKRAQILADL